MLCCHHSSIRCCLCPCHRLPSPACDQHQCWTMPTASASSCRPSHRCRREFATQRSDASAAPHTQCRWASGRAGGRTETKKHSACFRDKRGVRAGSRSHLVIIVSVALGLLGGPLHIRRTESHISVRCHAFGGVNSAADVLRAWISQGSQAMLSTLC
jgi:hypothetical protein